MSTVSQKLEYLNTTKGKIKDSINLTGAGITNNDTFRSYAVKLRDGLVNVLNNGTIVLYNNFPKVSGTGSNISLSNTLEAPMFMNKFDGDTYQQTYIGKNLFNNNNVVSVNNSTLEITTTGFNVTRTHSSGYGDEFIASYTIENLSPNTTYTFNLDVETENNYGNGSIYVYSDQLFGTTLTKSNYVNSGNNHKWNITTSSNGKMVIGFYGTTATQNKIFKFTNIQLESGSSKTSYEPYTGGQASPNPSYPQDIQSVEGIQNITISDGTDSDSYEVNLEGKNLFDGIFENGGWDTVTGDKYVAYDRIRCLDLIKVKPNTTYTFSFENDGSVYALFYDKNKTYLNKFSLIMYHTTTGSVTTNANTQYITFYYIPYNHTLTTNEQCQLEVGDTATTYVPYRSPIKLYNGDKIVGMPDNWSIYKEYNNIILNGTQTIAIANWRPGETSVGWVYSYNEFNNAYVPASTIGDIISNKLIASKFDDLFQKNKDNGIAVYVNTDYSIAVRTSDTTLTTSTLINNYLSNNPIEVVYKLATPTTTPITDTYLISQLNALYNAKSYNGQTNITVSGNLPMILEVSVLKGE